MTTMSPSAPPQSETLSCDHGLVFCRNLLDSRLIDVQMGSHHFRRETSDPVVHGEVHILVGLEHFEKDQICIACVLDVVPGDRWNVANIIGIEVHRARSPRRHEYSHAPLAREVELPLGGIWVPVQLAHAPRLKGDQCGGDVLRGREIVRVDDADFASGCFLCRGHRSSS